MKGGFVAAPLSGGANGEAKVFYQNKCSGTPTLRRDAFFRASSLPDVALHPDHRQAGETTFLED